MKKRLLVLTVILISTTYLFSQTALADDNKAQLGVYLEELTDKLQKKLNYTGDGVFVEEIIEDSGAEEAGIEEQDIIVEFNGTKLTSVKNLRRQIKKTTPGDKADVKIFRDGKFQTLKVIMGEDEEHWDWTGGEPWIDKFIHVFEDERPWLGIQIQELNSQLTEYFKVKSGVLVSEVVEDAPADKAGLKAGDIIIGWGDRDIVETDDIFEHLDESKVGDEIELKIVRNGNKTNKKVTLDEGGHDDHSYHFYYNDDDEDDMIHFRKWGKHGSIHIPPDIDIDIPDIDIDIDAEELRESIEEYRESTDTYKSELKNLKKELEKLKEELKEMRKKKGD